MIRRTPTSALVRAAREFLAASRPLTPTGHRRACTCDACHRVWAHGTGIADAKEQILALVPALVARLLQAEVVVAAWRGLAFVLVSVDDPARLEAAVAAIERAHRGDGPDVITEEHRAP